MKTAKCNHSDQTVNNKKLSTWIIVWFCLTAIICTWDATFIMLRPYTLPGGSLAWFWYFYKYYVTVDQRYQDTKDAYVFAQSLLNYVEVAVNIVTIVMHYRSSRHTTITAFMVSVMTFWKTILYFLMFSEFCTGGEYRHGNTALQEFLLVVIPNVVWVIVPLGVMYSLWQQLIPQGHFMKSLNAESFGNVSLNSGDGIKYVIKGQGYGNGRVVTEEDLANGGEIAMENLLWNGNANGQADHSSERHRVNARKVQ